MVRDVNSLSIGYGYIRVPRKSNVEETIQPIQKVKGLSNVDYGKKIYGKLIDNIKETLDYADGNPYEQNRKLAEEGIVLGHYVDYYA